MDWRKALEQPVDEGRLTRLVAQALSEHAIVALVAIEGSLSLSIKLNRDNLPNSSVSLSLAPLCNSLHMNQTTPRVWLVQRFMRHWLTMLETDFEVREQDRAHIFPTLKNDNWRNACQGLDIMAKPIARDLWLSYQIERNGGSFFLGQNQLEALKLQQNELKSLALRNLFRHHGPKPILNDHGQQVYALEMDKTYYGAVLLADEGLWRTIRRDRGIHRLLAAAPCECHVFFTDADDADSVRALKRKVEDVFHSDTEAPLSPELLWRTSGPWRAYGKARLESV